MAETDPILICVRDLLFSSRIVSAAKELGTPFKVVRDPARLAEVDGIRLIVDLNHPGTLEAAAAWKARTGRPVVGFVSHVDETAIAQARSAGLEVMSNGGFTARMQQVLAGN